MNFANIELSKELYELSGWDDTGKVWCSYIGRGSTAIDVKPWVRSVTVSRSDDVPAYDLGYLLRKLKHRNPFLYVDGDDKWKCRDAPGSSDWYASIADTPEDTAAKLAIQLFKNGILRKDK